jgi:hypothetical protein
VNNIEFRRKMGQPHKRGQKAIGGRRQGFGLVSIKIAFDDDMFAAIAESALAKNVSFAEVVRTYCEWGLENDC